MSTTETAVRRTPAETVARIKALEASDFFGWSRELLIGYLPFDEARPFLVEGALADQWEPRTDPRADLIDYLPFAWEKALGERGISANRSTDKIEQWLWLAGLDDLAAEYERAPYPQYGRPKLAVVTRALAPEKMPSVDDLI